MLADDDYFGIPSTIVNPAFVIKDWGEHPVEVKLGEKTIKPGKDFRVGYEPTPAGTSLVLWLRFESKEPVNISLRKVEKRPE